MTYHGFYQSIGRYAYPEHCRTLWADQVARGFVTSTVYLEDASFFDAGNRARGGALLIEAMLEVGVIRADFPVLLLQASGEEALALQAHATRPWPELIIANIDDPNPAQAEAVAGYAEEARAHGFRGGTAIHGSYVPAPFSSVLDVKLVDVFSWRIGTSGDPAEIWAQSMFDLSQDPLRARALTGAWCWARRIPCLLVWAFTHSAETRVRADNVVEQPRDEEGWNYSFAVPTPDGPPLTTPGYLGLAEGIADCRALEWAEETDDGEAAEWLEPLRQSFYHERMPDPRIAGQFWHYEGWFPALDRLKARHLGAMA